MDRRISQDLSKNSRISATSLWTAAALVVFETAILTVVAVTIYGLVVAFITFGELSVLDNRAFTIELLVTYVLGNVIGMSTDKVYLLCGRESIANNPVVVSIFSLVIITSITSLQVALPQIFSFYTYIQEAMGEGTSVGVALCVDYVASLMTLVGVIAAYRFVLLPIAKKLLVR